MNELSKYPKPSVTVDNVVFGYDGVELKILLIKRPLNPFAGAWTLPGGFLNIQETPEETAARILEAKAGLKDIFLEQLYTFAGVGRDPRGRVISIAYYALENVSKHILPLHGEDVKWFPIKTLPKLGFDHRSIIDAALNRLKAKVHYQPVGFELLEQKFTLTELQCLYETILEAPIDKRNFRKRILETGMLTATGEKRTGLKNRAPELFIFNQKEYKRLLKEGFEFKI